MATLLLTYLPKVSRRYSRSARPSTISLKPLIARPISSSDVTGRRTCEVALGDPPHAEVEAVDRAGERAEIQ